MGNTATFVAKTCKETNKIKHNGVHCLEDLISHITSGK